MSRSSKTFSIRRKFILISFSIILFFSVAVSALLIKTQEKDLHQSLESKGKTMGLYIAGICKDALLLKDVMQLDSLVNESHHDQEILYTVIEDASGAILTTPIASLNQQQSLVKEVLAKSPPDSPLATTLATLRTKNDILELTQKIMVDDSPQGTVRIGLSEQNMHRQLNRAVGVIVISMAIITLALGIALHIGTNRLILKPITRICSATEEIAAGNLTVSIPVTTNDEIGILTQSLNTMTANLNQMVSGVGGITKSLNTITDVLAATALNVNDTAGTQAIEVGAAHQSIQDINTLINNIISSIEHLALSTAASRSSTIELIASIGEVANNSETLSSSVGGVSSSISEIIASVHEVNVGVDTLNMTASGTATSATQLAASIAEVEASVRQITLVSETVQQDAHNGQNAVKASLQGIMKIKSSSDITFDVISTLSDRVANIGNILSVIEEVTEQTELLALNAAIIAAQAGDHGKGFAVVADEIKELAERTNASTREISQVITGVQDETNRAVEAIKQAESAIDEGILLANQSGSALEQIYNGVEETVDQMREITKVTTEQAAASQAISSAMAGVSQLVQQIARATEEQSNGGQLILSATEEMNNLTENVLLSTREQHAGGKHIAEAVEIIAQQMQVITDDCAKEQGSNAKVIHAMETIRQTSAANLAASQQLNDAVSRMQAQIASLRAQIDSFTV